MTADYMLRRTGPSTAALQQKSDVDALAVDAEGVLHPADAAPAANEAALDDLIDALNIAHGVLGVPGAGDKPGWSAEIAMPLHAAPLPVPSSPAPAKTPPPAPDVPPLTLPMQAVAANGGTDIDGAVETTLSGPSAFEQHRESRSGRGGFGGRGGPRGGGDEADRGGSRGPNVPVILDLHVTGHIVAGSLTHLTIVQTRRVVLGGLTYTNVTNATFDVVR